MGYPIYKLLRAVNRQYPNNGFINFVDVREDIYDVSEDDPDYLKKDKLIPEDLRDIINEAIQETYINIARDEVWSFPTVPGQNQYALPEDCDLRDIQEVTRTFVGVRGPLRPPFGPPFRPGPSPEPEPEPSPEPEFDKVVTFEINELYGRLESTQGTPIGDYMVIYNVTEGDTLPEVPTVVPNEGYTFAGWSLDGETVIPDEELLATPITGDLTIIPLFSQPGGGNYMHGGYYNPNGNHNSGGEDNEENPLNG